MSADVPRAKPPLTTGGMLLVIVGVLILAPCGLCTAGVLVVGITDFLETSDRQLSLFFTGASLMVGGIPTAFGALLLFLGLRLRKSI